MLTEFEVVPWKELRTRPKLQAGTWRWGRAVCGTRENGRNGFSDRGMETRFEMSLGLGRRDFQKGVGSLAQG